MSLRTTRLLLREIEAGDVRDIHLYASDPDVCRYSPWGPNTLDQTREFVQECLHQQQVESRSDHTLAVTMNGALIGAVALSSLPDNAFSFGCTLNRSYWGMGLGTEAARCLLRWAVEDLGATSVSATCRPGNLASIRVLEKVGMVKDKLLTDHMWMTDHWEDSYLFVLPADALAAGNNI